MSEAAVDEEVGPRLRAVRQQSGLSQREIMRRTGVSNATISMIESGSLSPTVSLLKRVLSGLSMSLGDFFTVDIAGAEEKIFFAATELLELSRGGVSYRQVGRRLQGKAIQLLHERYEPGAATGKHPLRHEGEECGIVLSGSLRVTVRDRTRLLQAGDAYYFRSDQDHMFRNDGPEPCTLVTACTPPTV